MKDYLKSNLDNSYSLAFIGAPGFGEEEKEHICYDIEHHEEYSFGGGTVSVKEYNCEE